MKTHMVHTMDSYPLVCGRAGRRPWLHGLAGLLALGRKTREATDGEA